MGSPPRTIWVDATMASVHLLWTYSVQVTPGTIRKWGERYEGIRRDQGQYRYDLQAVIDHARRMGALGDQ